MCRKTLAKIQEYTVYFEVNAPFFKRVNFVYLRVMIGAIQVDDMTGEPAYRKETDEHKDSFGQASP